MGYASVSASDAECSSSTIFPPHVDSPTSSSNVECACLSSSFVHSFEPQYLSVPPGSRLFATNADHMKDSTTSHFVSSTHESYIEEGNQRTKTVSGIIIFFLFTKEL